MFAYYAPDEADFNPQRLARATAYLDGAVNRGDILGAALLVAMHR